MRHGGSPRAAAQGEKCRRLTKRFRHVATVLRRRRAATVDVLDVQFSTPAEEPERCMERRSIALPRILAPPRKRRSNELAVIAQERDEVNCARHAVCVTYQEHLVSEALGVSHPMGSSYWGGLWRLGLGNCRSLLFACAKRGNGSAFRRWNSADASAWTRMWPVPVSTNTKTACTFLTTERRRELRPSWACRWHTSMQKTTSWRDGSWCGHDCRPRKGDAC